MAPFENKRIFPKLKSPAIVSNYTPSPESQDDFMRDIDWWKKTIIYQIYPRSFCDGNGDGLGDLRGLISKLDYFTYLNINCIWLSPIYASPMRDFGYDITDFNAIDPSYGTMEEFDELMKGLHKRGIKLLMDFVPNHTSNEHPLFKQCLKYGDVEDNPYRDYFVWCKGYTDDFGGRWPPNNWISMFGGSMWEYSEEMDSFFLHQFLPEMPDLNFRDPRVHELIEDSLKFWFNHEVDGMRIDAVKHLYEAENFYQHEEATYRQGVPVDHYDSQWHRLSVNQPETYEVVKNWRQLFDDYSQQTGRYRFMVAEIYEDWDTTTEHVMNYYDSGSDAPFNFRLVSRFKPETGGFGVRFQIEDWLSRMPPDRWSIWVTGNHDVKRVADKFGPEYANAINMLLLLLPGTPVTYYGEEIAMRGTHVSFEDTQDTFSKRFGPDLYHLFSRDSCRGPMLWDNSENGGFCPPGVKPWMPAYKDHSELNVEAQQNSKSTTPIQLYRELALLRREPEFASGTFQSGYTTENIYTIIRRRGPRPSEEEDDDPGNRYDVVLNVGREVEHFDSPATKLFFYDPETKRYPDVQGGRERPRIILHSNNLKHDQLDGIAGFPFAPLDIYPGQGFVIKSRPKPWGS